MTTYRATARREQRFWVVDVEGVGVTQGRNLAEAKIMAADLVVAMRDVDPGQVEIDMNVDLPGDLPGRAAQARRLVVEAADAQKRAAEVSRAVVDELRMKAGLSGKDVAAVLGVSEQRVSQLGARGSAEGPPRQAAKRTAASRQGEAR